MDPVTAFSIACGVIQVVDFSLQVLSSFRDFYKDGEIASNAGVADQAADLIALESSLEELVAGGANAPSAQLSREDLELRELARKSVGTAKDLSRQIATLKPATGRKRDAFKSSIKSMWKRNEMQDIQEKLDEYRKALDTRVLVNLSKRSDLLSLANSKTFNSLHQNVQNLITALQHGHLTMEKLVTNEGILIRSHITREFDRLRPSKDAELTKQLRRSLYFPDIFVRQEEVASAHRSTFEWIFDESVTAMRPWDNYAQWLRNGRGIYWMSGKAGSGKSTLMNFVLEDERTKCALQEWSGSSQLTTPSFFFWSLGSKLQKSTSGLLRALVYQIIGASTMLAGMLLDANPEFWPFGAGERSQLDITWTDKKLKTALRYLVNQPDFPLHQCFFIDGFDELEDGHIQILELFAELEQNPRVKLCVASRPWAVFETAFKSTPRLRLQDLTHSDIERYVKDKLNSSRLNPGGTSNPEWISIISRTIVAKADGCFLWCYLVVLTVLDGLACGDELYELKHRLNILPTEIEGLYKNLLTSIHPVHKQQVARLFHVILVASMDGSKERLNFGNRDSVLTCLFTFALTAHLSYRHDLTWPVTLTDDKIKEECEKTKKAIVTRTKGLLEIDDCSGFRLRKTFDDISKFSVRVFHKSLFDYLQKSPETLDALSEEMPSKSNQIHFLRSSLQARLLYFRSLQADSVDMYQLCFAYYMGFHHAGQLIALSRQPEEALVDELSRIMEDWRAARRPSLTEEPWAAYPIYQRGTSGLTGTYVCVDDFLHHAAAFRMTAFVIRKIEQVSSPMKRQLTASLLIYALLNSPREYLADDGFFTAAEILRLGAPPNLVRKIRFADFSRIFLNVLHPSERGGVLPFEDETTPWKQCLKTALMVMTDHNLADSDDSYKTSPRSKQRSASDLLNLVVDFLDAGANVNETVTISFPNPLLTPGEFKFSTESLRPNDFWARPFPDQTDKYALFWNVSAFHIMQICLKEQPGCEEVFERFRRNGAVACRSSPIFCVYRNDKKLTEELIAASVLTDEEFRLLERDLKRFEEGYFIYHDISELDLISSISSPGISNDGPLESDTFETSIRDQARMFNKWVPGIATLVKHWEQKNERRLIADSRLC